MRFIKFGDAIISVDRIESIEYLGDREDEYAIRLCLLNTGKMIIERFGYDINNKLEIEYEALGRMDDLLAQLNK